MKVKMLNQQRVGEGRPTVNGSGYQVKGPPGLGILALKGLPPCSREVLRSIPAGVSNRLSTYVLDLHPPTCRAVITFNAMDRHFALANSVDAGNCGSRS